MKYRDTYRKKKYGFTLVEVVVVLVITAIIAAFAVPGITNYLDNARRTRQEQTVRLLYSAAQNKLTYLSANDPEGKYTDFRALFEDDSITIAGTKYEGRGTGPEDTPVVLDVVRKIGRSVSDELGAPINANGTAAANESEQIPAYSALYQMSAPETNGAKAVQALLGESGLYNIIEKGDCRIDIDPSLRFILRVSYQNVSLSFPSVYNDSNVDVPESANPDKVQLKLNVNAKNAEKLTVEVSCDSLAGYDAKPENYKLSMVMTSKSGGRFETKNVAADWCEGSGASRTLTLDSLESNMGFDYLFNTYGFTPGEDVTVTFQLYYDGPLTDKEGNPITVAPSAEYSVVVNSMFAGVEGDTTYISYGRHLQNLQKATTANVVQSGDINWKKSTQEEYGADFALNPITNAAITSFSGMKSTTQHTISNLVVDGETGNAGIFATSSADFSHVRLLNPTVSGGGDTGALVGELTGGSITNCRAYITDTENLSSYNVTTTSGNAGGLVGAVSGSAVIENSFVSLNSVSADISSGYAGGLVGVVSGKVEINSCYSNMKDLCAKYVGGFVGSVDNKDAVISYSYAVTEVLKGGNVAAGFTAANAGSIGVSYALVGSVRTEESTGTDRLGFAPAGSGMFSSCFFYAKELEKTGEGAGTPESTVRSMNEDITDVATGWVYDVDDDGKTTVNGFSHPYTAYDASDENAPYNYMYQEDAPHAKLAYPAPRIPNLDHYGDWPLPADNEGLDCEIRNGDQLILSVSVTTEDDDEIPEFVTLCLTGADSKKAIVLRLKYSSGNWSIVKKATATAPDPKVQINYEDATRTLPFKFDTVNKKLIFTLDDVTMAGRHFAELFPDLIPGENIRIKALSGIPDKWEDLENGVVTNSLFASRSGDTVHITATRHLQNLDPLISSVTPTVTAAALDKNLTWNNGFYGTSIYNADSKNSVSGTFYGLYNPNLTTFDGQHHRLTGYPLYSASADFSTTGAHNAGLFRYVDSALTVKNLMLEGADVNAAGNAGTVITEVAGSGAVTLNTVLVVPKDGAGAVTGSGVAGGLVGSMNGTSLTIKNSASAVTMTAAGQVGGLLGYQGGGNVIITESYVGGHTTNMKYPTENDSDYNIRSTGAAVGGLIGEAAGGTLTVKNSFGAASVSAAADHPSGGLIGSVGIHAALDHVYVVAPVSHVQVDMDTTARTDVVYGNTPSGMLIGSIAAESTVTNEYSYYLPEVYPETTQMGGISSVAYVGAGDGVLTSPVLLAFYMDGTNEISATLADDDGIEQTMQTKTYPYDTKLVGDKGYHKEYPFSIWTEFRFDSTQSWRSYYGDWQPIQNPPTELVTVSFYYDNPFDSEGTLPAPDKKLKTQKLHRNEKNKILAPALQSIPGYRVTGWQIGDTSTVLPVTSEGWITLSEELCTADMELYAQLEVIEDEVTVSFYYDPTGLRYDADPATTSDYVQINSTKTLKRGADGHFPALSSLQSKLPSRNVQDYEFVGWYRDPELTQPLDFTSGAEVTESIRVYAKYTPIQYNMVMIDFLFSDTDGELTGAIDVPRYRVSEDDDEIPRYTLQFIQGRGFNEDVALPNVSYKVKALLQYSDDGSKLIRPASSTAALNPGNKSISVHTDGDLSLAVIYEVDNAQTDVYQVFYTFENTTNKNNLNTTLLTKLVAYYEGKDAEQIDAAVEANFPYHDDESCSIYCFEFSVPQGAAPVTPQDQLEKDVMFFRQFTVSEEIDRAKYTVTYKFTRRKYTIEFNTLLGSYIAPVELSFGQQIYIAQPTTEPRRAGYSIDKTKSELGWVILNKGDDELHATETKYHWGGEQTVTATVKEYVTDSMYSANTTATSNVFGLVNGNLEQLTYKSKKYYYTSGSRSVEYKDTRYVPATTEDNRFFYDSVSKEMKPLIRETVGLNSSEIYYQTNNTTNNPQKYGNSGGKLVPISRSGIRWYIGNTTRYSGTVYAKWTGSETGTSYIHADSDGNITTDVTRSGNSFTTYRYYYEKEDSVLYNQPYSNMPAKNLVAVVQWKEVPADYRVAYWYENADDGGYSYMGGDTFRGMSGDIVESADFSDYRGKSFSWQDTTNFSFNAAKTETAAVQGDGSTVLNVYFKRKEYTLTFKSNDWNNPVILEVTRKYDASVVDIFPVHGTDGVVYGVDRVGNWEDKNKTVYNYILMTIDRMPASNVTFTFNERTTKKGDIYYYLETAKGVDYSDKTLKTQNGKTFYLYKSTSHTFNYLTKDEEFHVIAGFTEYGYLNSDGRFAAGVGNGTYYAYNTDNQNVNEFYYARESYDLIFMYLGDTVHQESVQYESPLSKFADYVPPTRPEGLDPNSRFRGWYQDPTLTTPADFSASMPLGNLVLYARWDLPDIDVEFYSNLPGEDDCTLLDDLSLTITMQKTLVSQMCNADGTLLDKYQLSRPVGSKTQDFVNWVYLDESGKDHPYIPSMQIPGADGSSDFMPYTQYYPIPDDVNEPVGKVKLYAKWPDEVIAEDATITVHMTFDDGTPSRNEPLLDKNGDPITYPENSFARVLAQDVYGYYPESMVTFLNVQPGENIINVHYCKIQPWEYTVKYYARYSSLETLDPGDDDLELVLETNHHDYLIPALNRTGTADNYFSTVQYQPPAGYENYRLCGYRYNDSEYTVSSTFVTVYDNGTRELCFFIEPDPSLLSLDDTYTVYNGSPQAVKETEHTEDVLLTPSTVDATLLNYYRYCDPDGTPTPDEDIVNTGAYRMNAYIVLSVTGTPEGESTSQTYYFLLRKDVSHNMNLRIGKRNVILTSQSLYRLYDPDKQSLKANEASTDILISGDDFAPGEGADYVFSVEAFRKDVGVSENSFSYTLWTGETAGQNETLEDNYDIQVVYGNLSVYWEYNLTVYADFAGLPADDATAARLGLSEDAVSCEIERLEGIRVSGMSESLSWDPSEQRQVGNVLVSIVPAAYAGYVQSGDDLEIKQPESASAPEAALHVCLPSIPAAPLSGATAPASETVEPTALGIAAPYGMTFTVQRIYDYYKSGSPIDPKNVTAGDYTRDVYTVLEIHAGTDTRRYLLAAEKNRSYTVLATP